MIYVFNLPHHGTSLTNTYVFSYKHVFLSFSQIRVIDCDVIAVHLQHALPLVTYLLVL
jgi:hypothetical protein